MFEVQKLFLSCNGDLDKFRAELTAIGVDQREYPELKMMLLDYNQIECLKNHSVVLECRGLLMDYNGNIVRKGFTRFFNLGECGVFEFDFVHSIAFEKADGSLCFIYHCPATNQFELGTRGTAFAEGPANFHPTFRDFMLACMGRIEEQFQEDCEQLLRKDVTYVLESIGPDNRIVTGYTENQLVFLSSFVTETGEEDFTLPFVDLMSKVGWNVRHIRQYKFNTQEDCMIALGGLTGLQEGYVVLNTLTGTRVKIKNAIYLAAHRLRGNGLTINSLCELVVMGEVDEYTATFPEDLPKFVPVQNILNCIYIELEEEYLRVKDIESQKDFALAIKDFDLSCVLFKTRAKKTTTTHEFNQFPVSKRADWVKDRLLAAKVVGTTSGT
jgi:hypothetical protein